MVSKRIGNAELEPVRAGGSLSTLEGRSRFATLIYYHALPAVDDLLRLINISAVPCDTCNSRSESHRDYLNTVLLHHLMNEQPANFLVDRGIGNDACLTPVIELLQFLRLKGGEFEEALARTRTRLGDTLSSRTDVMIHRTALDETLPDYHSVSKVDSLRNFKALIDGWSIQWCLMDGWCLELAFDAVKSFVCGLVDWVPEGNDDLLDHSLWWRNEAFRTRLVKLSWFEAVAKFSDASFCELIGALKEIPENPDFSFTWAPFAKGDKRVFQILDRHTPYSYDTEDFKKRVEREFWFKFFTLYENSPGLLVGNLDKVKDRITRLMNRIDDYLAKCSEKQRRHGRPRKSKPSGDIHFRWAVLFQLARLSTNEIAKIEIGKRVGAQYQGYSEEEGAGARVGLSPSTVRGGIKDVAELIGLTLRIGKRGRPSGRKDAEGHIRNRAKK